MIDFTQLSRFQKRTFVSEEAKLKDLSEIKSMYEKLLNAEINSKEELENWLLNWSELETAIDQLGSILYIQMTSQTDDKARARAYKAFMENIVPAIKPLEDQLNQKYLEMNKLYELDPDRYAVFHKSIQTEVELFVKENVSIQTELDMLSQKYQTICGSITVNFQGKEYTLPEMGKYLLDPDRKLRESAWRATSDRRLLEKDKLDDIFDKMVSLRDQVAKNAKCDNYCDYKFRALHRFDYTPQDCVKYHQAVEKCIVPLWGEILEERKKQMQVEHLRPWDTAVDPLGRPSLKPFDHADQLIEGCREVFKRVDNDLGSQFSQMADEGLLDLMSRKGKAPGGYQSTLSEARKPFIFMNAVGVDSDLRTLLHEAGHAFHSLACAGDPLLHYRHGPMEFCEVASMSMEILAGKHISVFYNEQDEKRSSRSHWENIISVLVWVATIDAFQHWIYENPKHNALERKQAWLDLRARFSAGKVNWDGFEEEHSYLWHRQLHIFEVPFYYIEYAIAQLGALQVWLNSKKDWKGTLSRYRQGLALGGSKPLPELFKAAGIRFDFSEETIAVLMEDVKKEL